MKFLNDPRQSWKKTREALTLGSLLFLFTQAFATPVALTYEQAVEEGLKANLDLIAAKYNVPMAEADELTAGLWANPSLTLDTASQPFKKNWDQTTVGGPSQYDAILAIPLDLTGKHSTAKKSAHEATRIAQATLQDTVRLKVLQIRLAYVDILGAKQKLNLAQEKQQDLDRLLATIKNRIGNRNLLPLIQRRAQLAHDQATLEVKADRVTLKAATTTLAQLMGRPPTGDSVMATTELRDFTMVGLPEVDSLIQRALESRPDLLALKVGITKADRDIDAARSQVWDDFTWTLGYTKLNTLSANPDDPNSSETPGASSWQMGVQIPLPLLNRNQGSIQKSLLSRSQSEKALDALVLSIRQEIDELYDDLKLNQELIHDYETSQLGEARKIHDAEQTQFGTGNSALLDYFDAMGAYYSTLSSYYDALAEYRRAVARLQSSVGKDALL